MACEQAGGVLRKELDVHAETVGRKVPKTLILLSVVIFALVSAGCGGRPGQSVSNHSEQPSKDPIKLSKDQQTVVDELGYPASFSIYLDEVDGKPIRKETWRYHGVGSTFMFSNGTFELLKSDLSPAPADSKAPTVRPTQFGPKTDRADITALIGKPQAQAKINPELLKGAKVYQYSGGVTVGMAGDRVVYVEANLYRPKSGNSDGGGETQ